MSDPPRFGCLETRAQVANLGASLCHQEAPVKLGAGIYDHMIHPWVPMSQLQEFLSVNLPQQLSRARLAPNTAAARDRTDARKKRVFPFLADQAGFFFSFFADKVFVFFSRRCFNAFPHFQTFFN